MSVEEVSATDVSDEELDAVLSTAAIYSNKIYATPTPAGLRLTFGETRGRDDHGRPRASVLLNYQTTAELLEILHLVLRDVKFIEMPKPKA